MLDPLFFGKKVLLMSMAQFDDFFDICCDLMEEEKTRLKVKASMMENPVDLKVHANTKWWEEALKEIETENEYELYYI